MLSLSFSLLTIATYMMLTVPSMIEVYSFRLSPLVQVILSYTFDMEMSVQSIGGDRT